jgi:hypothetical protein
MTQPHVFVETNFLFGTFRMPSKRHRDALALKALFGTGDVKLYVPYLCSYRHAPRCLNVQACKIQTIFCLGSTSKRNARGLENEIRTPPLPRFAPPKRVCL